MLGFTSMGNKCQLPSYKESNRNNVNNNIQFQNQPQYNVLKSQQLSTTFAIKKNHEASVSPLLSNQVHKFYNAIPKTAYGLINMQTHNEEPRTQNYSLIFNSKTVKVLLTYTGGSPIFKINFISQHTIFEISLHQESNKKIVK